MRTIILYFFFASLNFEVGDPFNTGGVFTVTKLLGFIYVFTLIPQFTRFMATQKIAHILIPLWLFYGLLTAMNIVNSRYDVIAINDYFSMLMNIFLFWFLINQERKGRLVLEKCMVCFALGAVAEACLFQAGVGVDEVGGRISMFGDNPNGIGLRMVIGIIIFALLVGQDRLRLGKVRYLFLVPLPIMLRLLIETGSRASLASFALALVIGTVLFKTKRMLYKIGAFGLGSFVVFYGWQRVVADESTWDRIMDTVYNGDLAGRDIIWTDLLPLIAKHPFFGSGETGYLQFTYETFGGFTSPHNVFLEVLCYTGVVGLFIYLWFLWQVFRGGWQSYKTEGWLLPLVLWSPVVGCLLSGQVLVWKLIWCILAYNVGNSLWTPNLAGRRRGTRILPVNSGLESRPRVPQSKPGKVVVGEEPI